MDGNPFADLIPRASQAASQNPFADLIPQSEPGMSWGQAFSRGMSNMPQDAANIAMGVAQLGTPEGQGKFLWNSAKTGVGLAEKAFGLNPIGSEQQNANDLIDYFKGYTSSEGIKKKIAEHPVGTALDVATLATPLKGLGLAAKGTELAAEIAPKIATSAELKAAGGAGLEAAKGSGVYFTSDFVKPLRDTLLESAQQMNFRPGRPGSAEVRSILKDVDSMANRPWSFSDIHNLQMDLNDAWKVAKKAGRDQIAGVAGRMRGIVNQFLDNVDKANGEGLYATGDITPERASQIFQESKKVYRQAKVAQKLESIGQKAAVDSAQFAVSGEANALGKYARQVLRAHYDGKPTGFNPQEIKTLEQFNKGSFAEWALKKVRRFRGPVGAILGAQVGGWLGSVAAMGLGEGAARLADHMAIRRFNNFISDVRENGSTRLEGLLGQAMHDHMMGTEAGKSAIRKWTESIGTKSFNGASRALALAAAQMVKRPDLVPQIYGELKKLEKQLQDFASQWQGEVPAEAQPQQQQ